MKAAKANRSIKSGKDKQNGKEELRKALTKAKAQNQHSPNTLNTSSPP
jgi:hypothetical protein